MIARRGGSAIGVQNSSQLDRSTGASSQIYFYIIAFFCFAKNARISSIFTNKYIRHEKNYPFLLLSEYYPFFFCPIDCTHPAAITPKALSINTSAHVTITYNNPSVTSPTGEDRTSKIRVQLVSYGLTNQGFVPLPHTLPLKSQKNFISRSVQWRGTAIICWKN